MSALYNKAFLLKACKCLIEIRNVHANHSYIFFDIGFG